MRSLNSIQQSLKGKTRLERIAILKKEAKSLNEIEREIYKKFYEKAQTELRTKRTVCAVVMEMDRHGLFFQSESYFPLEYQIACIVTGNPVHEPSEIIKEARKKRGYKPRKEFIPPIFDRTVSPLFQNKRGHTTERDYNE